MRPATGVLQRVVTAPRLTSIVDVGASPIDGDPLYGGVLDDVLCRVTGFEPQPEALARRRAGAGPLGAYLPAVVGDGGVVQLHVAAASGVTSLLKPDPHRLSLFSGFPGWGEVIEVVELATTRLDDVPDLDEFDMLKIDVQAPS